MDKFRYLGDMLSVVGGADTAMEGINSGSWYHCSPVFNIIFFFPSVYLFPIHGQFSVDLHQLGMLPPHNFWMVMGRFVKRSSFVFKRKSAK